MTEQKLTKREREILEKGYQLYDLFRAKNKPYKDEVRIARQISMIQDPEQAHMPQLHTLRSTLVNCISDQMDNIPDAIVMPERPDMQVKAEQLTDVTRYIMDINDMERLHRERVEDNFITGTSYLHPTWDRDKAYGKGDVSILVCPVESLEWDYLAADIQEGRAFFRTVWNSRPYYKQHYPDVEPYIQSISKYTRDDGVQSADDEDEDIPLIEYWYREYDSKTRKYKVHVAHMAGYALLYYSEKEFKNGMYDHGLYPFIPDVYTRIPGRSHGQGMVMELAPIQRSINRYAQYIDDNARANSKMRILVGAQAEINDEELRDMDKQIIHGQFITDAHIRWFPDLRMSPAAQNQMFSFIDMLKQDSGQNQFSRGETAGGVTAASAIGMLQEAGGKTSRFRTSVFKYGTKEMVEQVLWLIRQFYDKDRVVMITGRQGETIPVKPKELFGNDDIMPFAVRIQIQRKNPFQVQQENEFLMQWFNAAAQMNIQLNPQTMLKLLQVDGKDRLMAAIEDDEQEAQQAQMQEMAQQNQALGQQNQALGQEILALRDMLVQQAAALGEKPTTV